MKRIIRVLALMLVAAMLCVALVACGSTPNKDPEKAKDALEDNGYEVRLVDDENVLEMYGHDGLVACIFASKIDPKIDLDAKDESWAALDGELVIYDLAIIFYFEDEDAARNAFVDLEAELNDDIEWEADLVADETNENNKALNVEVTVKFDWQKAVLDGCMIYVGTSGALSDAA